MTKRKHIYILMSLSIALVFISIVSLSKGEIEVPFIDVLKSLIGHSTPYFNKVIQEIRLPRIIVAICVGATLSVSGFFTSITMKNSLADSGILGIQSGATVGALIAILLIPTMITFLPLFAFVGGLIAFLALLLAVSSKKGFQPSKVVLVGVGLNSISTSIIGILTILNADKIKNALTWLNGSLATVSKGDMQIVLLYSLVLLIIIFLLVPIAKLLLLPDQFIMNIGYEPDKLRIGLATIAVLVASISVAFVGIISFIGIIAPQISRRLFHGEIRIQLIGSALIGGLLVVSADFIQRMLFSPIEIPVGILIGLVGAPVFIYLSGKDTYDYVK